MMHMDQSRERHQSHSLHAFAYALFQNGQDLEAVARALMELGVDEIKAREISSFAQTSYRSDRAEAVNSHLQKGSLALIGGLLVTLFTYAAAGPGGTYLIATGALLYGVINLIAGLLLRAKGSLTPEDGLRISYCLLLIGVGGGLVFIAERFAAELSYDATYRVIYWIMLICGYQMAILGIGAMIDKSAMRLRTGDPAIDALTAEDVRKAGWFFLVAAGIIAVHLIVEQSGFFVREDPAKAAHTETAIETRVSPLVSPLQSPLRKQ
jgi:hypothetical protein